MFLCVVYFLDEKYISDNRLKPVNAVKLKKKYLGTTIVSDRLIQKLKIYIIIQFHSYTYRLIKKCCVSPQVLVPGKRY